MRASDYRRQGSEWLSGQWGITAWVVIQFFVIHFIVNGLANLIGTGSFFADYTTTNDGTANIFQGIMSILILMPLTVGLYISFLNNARENGLRNEYLYAFFTNGRYWRTVGLTFVESIFIGLWFLLFIIPGIIKSFSYSQTYYIWKDNPNISILDAITASRHAMKGNKWALFCVYFSFIGWYLLGIITLGIGFIWIVPYVASTSVAFYEDRIRAQIARK